MSEIKVRVAEIDRILNGWRNNNEASEGSCEAAALQMRKIYELVGFAAMSADLERYKNLKPKFAKEWNFPEIIKAISRVNSEFLPKPVRRVKSSEEGVTWHLEERPEAVLSMEDLITRHGFLHRFLHARNPFGVKFDVLDALRRLDTWVREIASLLSQHRYVVGPLQEGYIVELNAQGVDVTIFEYTRKE